MAYEIDTETLTLFIPPLEPDEVIWSGLPLSAEEALRRYDVDDVQWTTEVNSFLARVSSSSSSSSSRSPSTVWAIDKHVSDEITFLNFDIKDMTSLKEAIDECRVRKDDYEVALVRRANDISAAAHTAVLRSLARSTNERELQASFIQTCIAQGCREQAYQPVVASGENAATLHYVKNDESLHGRLNLLLDAGGEYHCYAADITRTFPINGRISEESRDIYDIVLRMQEECIRMIKGGVAWERVHEHAHRVAIDGLLKLAILRGGSIEDIFRARTSLAFFPHGLGHHLGMDTHDTGGHPNYSDPDPMFRYLRVRGDLPTGSIITVEPGVSSASSLFVDEPRPRC